MKTKNLPQTENKNLKLFYILGISFSTIALVMLCIIENSFSDLANYSMKYMFSFLTIMLGVFLQKKMNTYKNNLSITEIRIYSVIAMIWICIPSTIIYINIVNKYFPYNEYKTLLNILIASVFACLFLYSTIKLRKQTSI